MSETHDIEQQVVGFLKENPDFFVQHPELLASIQVPDPHGGRAISLHERQLEVLREKLRLMDRKVAEFVRIGHENDAISEKMMRWARQLLLAADASLLPQVVVDGMHHIFSVPQVALRLWRVREAYQGLSCSIPVDADAMALASSMKQPYCGPNAEFRAAGWLPEGGSATRSIALMPLRKGVDPNAFGMLVLGSADAGRFDAEMGTAFLEQIAEVTSAALSRLIE